MSYSGGKVTAPINQYDIQRAVSNSSPHLNVLITQGTINKWAKFKPVRKALKDTTGQLKSDKTWKDDSDWWKGTNGKCGISYNTYSSLSSLKTAIDGQSGVFSYLRPNGGDNAPYRWVDFNEYNGNAPAPTIDFNATDAVMQPNAVMIVSVANSFIGGDNLILSDISGLDSMYFTAFFYDSQGTLKFIHSQDVTIGTDPDMYMEIPYMAQQVGGYANVFSAGQTYTVYVCLSSYQYTCATSEHNNVTYVPLPDDNNSHGIGSHSIQAIQSDKWLRVSAFTVGSNSTVVNWEAWMYGGTTPQAATIRLIDIGGTVRDTKNIDFLNGTVVYNPNGWKLTSNASNALTMPTAEPEQYMVELISNGYLSARVNIMHEIS